MLYSVFAFLVTRALQAGRPRWRTLAVVAVWLTAWGSADEWHQKFIPGRGADVADWAADTVGVLAGLALRRAWSARPIMRTA
jgi:VanZ family protein